MKPFADGTYKLVASSDLAAFRPAPSRSPKQLLERVSAVVLPVHRLGNHKVSPTSRFKSLSLMCPKDFFLTSFFTSTYLKDNLINI